jgi:hypothetical protein
VVPPEADREADYPVPSWPAGNEVVVTDSADWVDSGGVVDVDAGVPEEPPPGGAVLRGVEAMPTMGLLRGVPPIDP